jgi:hypothetical protein
MAALPLSMEHPIRTIAVARLWHEGDSFTPVPTRLADGGAGEEQGG